MRELPILMNGPMVRATLADIKTVTRRPITDLRGFGRVSEFGQSTTPPYRWQFRDKQMRWNDLRHLALLEACPYGKAGERLYVRETAFREPHPGEFGLTQADMPTTWDIACAKAGQMTYRADYLEPLATAIIDGRRWTPSIHMPKAWARLWLQLEHVGIERVQDISEQQAIAEGIYQIDIGSGYRPVYSARDAAWADAVEGEPGIYDDPRLAFRDLWEMTYPGSWNRNDFVWALEFRRNAQERKAA